MNQIPTEWKEEKAKLEQWVKDLHSGMYINCVYCGHRYGPKESTPVAMADVLKTHIEQCPKHPLKIANDKICKLEGRFNRILKWVNSRSNIHDMKEAIRQECEQDLDKVKGGSND